MKPPRFTFRFLLVAVTIAAVLTCVTARLIIERPVTLREAYKVKVGMSALEVRWHLGAPHHDFQDPQDDSWGYDYADSERIALDYLYVKFTDGKVVNVRQRQPYAPGL